MPSRDYSDLSRLALEADLDVDELRRGVPEFEQLPVAHKAGRNKERQ